MKKVISYLITAMMVFTMVPSIAFAGTAEQQAAEASLYKTQKAAEADLFERQRQAEAAPAKERAQAVVHQVVQIEHAQMRHQLGQLDQKQERKAAEHNLPPALRPFP